MMRQTRLRTRHQGIRKRWEKGAGMARVLSVQTELIRRLCTLFANDGAYLKAFEFPAVRYLDVRAPSVRPQSLRILPLAARGAELTCLHHKRRGAWGVLVIPGDLRGAG